jgi:hypothetical protein
MPLLGINLAVTDFKIHKTQSLYIIFDDEAAILEFRDNLIPCQHKPSTYWRVTNNWNWKTEWESEDAERVRERLETRLKELKESQDQYHDYDLDERITISHKLQEYKQWCYYAAREKELKDWTTKSIPPKIHYCGHDMFYILSTTFPPYYDFNKNLPLLAKCKWDDDRVAAFVRERMRKRNQVIDMIITRILARTIIARK